MDAKLKEDWVAALRSGKYRQGEGWLEKQGSYCCLGVLLKIKGVEPAEWPRLMRMASVLPDSYASGLRCATMTDLAKRNDGSCGVPKMTFPEIADYIEANL